MLEGKALVFLIVSRSEVMRHLWIPLVVLGVLLLTIAGGTAALLVMKSTVPAPTPMIAAPLPVNSAKQPPKEQSKLDRKEIQRDDCPAPHQADSNSVFTELNKEKSFLLETRPDGTKRIHLQADVCLRDFLMLEVLICKTMTKEHEAILRCSLDAGLIHAALVATGAKPGHPVQFVNPQTGDEDYKPATGDVITVTVHYNFGGTTFTHPAQEWIVDAKTKKPMTQAWVFAGSRFAKFPDEPERPEHYCANNGEVIAISNFPDSMLDLPVRFSSINEDLQFEANHGKIPAYGTRVWVILERAPAKRPTEK